MGIGIGIFLIVLGLIAVTGAVTLPDAVHDNVATDTLGWILLIVGTVAIALALVMNQQRQRTTYVEERRIDPLR